MTNSQAPIQGIAGWLKSCPKNVFPKEHDYAARFKTIEDYFNEYVHPKVDIGALLRDKVYYTDHGPDHIRSIMERARALTLKDDDGYCLSAYEVYILLVAAHVHDTGKAFGNKEHEKRYHSGIEWLRSVTKDDTEIRIIRQIAGTHSGHDQGDKDTIGHLPKKEYVSGVSVRMRFLAGILRFADELADDKTRASRFLIENQTLPKESEVFHYYALHLEPPVFLPETQEINLHFVLNNEVAKRKMGKGNEEVFLLDEIYKRTFKMHLERTYCMRFMRPDIQIEKISVRIEVFRLSTDMLPWETVQYTIEERGYPEFREDAIYTLCCDLMTNGNRKDGLWLMKKIEEESK
jgi:hypothetical protein